MESRVNKYNNDNEQGMTRTKKNANLYSEINELAVNKFDVNSNSYVLANNGRTIDVDKLKDMLDKKYREDTKDKSLSKTGELDTVEAINLDETREFDINAILSKAKEEKQTDNYEIERLKKLRNTQVDILNDLNIEEYNDKIKAVSDEEGDKLQDLINTINLTEETNAIKNLDLDPLDILSDLKGDDDETKVEGVNQLTQEILKEAQRQIDEENKNRDIKEEAEKQLENSFYTTSSSLKLNDFDDFADLKDDITATKVVIKILIFLIIIAFICGAVFLLNNIFEWGLF